jgi:hypothetical protein
MDQHYNLTAKNGRYKRNRQPLLGAALALVVALAGFSVWGEFSAATAPFLVVNSTPAAHPQSVVPDGGCASCELVYEDGGTNAARSPSYYLERRSLEAQGI